MHYLRQPFLVSLPFYFPFIDIMSLNEAKQAFVCQYFDVSLLFCSAVYLFAISFFYWFMTNCCHSDCETCGTTGTRFFFYFFLPSLHCTESICGLGYVLRLYTWVGRQRIAFAYPFLSWLSATFLSFVDPCTYILRLSDVFQPHEHTMGCRGILYFDELFDSATRLVWCTHC